MYACLMSVIVRAAITDAEWKALRKRAIDRGTPIQNYVAHAIRELLKKEKVTA